MGSSTREGRGSHTEQGFHTNFSLRVQKEEETTTTMQQSADQRLPIAIAMPVPVLFQNGNGPGWWQGQGQPRTHEFHTVLPAVQAVSSA